MSSPRTPGTTTPRVALAARVDWRSWYVPGALCAITLLAGALFWPSTQTLLHEWFEIPTSAYRHGSLIVLITLWLFVRATRGEALPDRAAGFPWPLVLLAAASVVWLIAFRAGIQVAHQALLPVIIWLSVRSVLGARITALATMPIGLLYSAIPLWHVLVPALQAMTVAVVSVSLRIVGVPAYVTGDYVHIRSGVFHIEDGCAGLHYFIVAATIAALYGELRDDRRGTRIYLLVLAMALALLGNWLRVFIIIVAGDLTDMQNYLVRVDHSVFGWFVFAFAMVIFLLLGRMRPQEPAPSAATIPPGGAHAAAFVPILVLTALAAAIGPAWSRFLPISPAAGPNVSVMEPIEGWAGPTESCHGRWRPLFASADLQTQVEFSRGAERVCFYSATYLLQYQDKELIGFFNSVYDPESEVVSMGTQDDTGRTVNEVQLANDTVADRIVWSAYAVDDREMRRGVAAQLSYALGTLHGAPAASVYAISTTCVPDCAAARERLRGFLPHVRVGAGAKAE